MNQPTDEKLERICEQALAMCLSTSDNQVGSSIQVKLDSQSKVRGLWVFIKSPSPLVPSEELYRQIYAILYYCLLPAYTLSSSQMIIRTFPGDDFSLTRGFWFMLHPGIPTRLVGTVDQIMADVEGMNIPLEKNLTINTSKVAHIFIAGNTGSGKTYAVLTLIRFLLFMNSKREYCPLRRVSIIDPKKSTIARTFKTSKDVELLLPQAGERAEDFILRVNTKLQQVLDDISNIQDKLYEQSPDPDCDYRILGKDAVENFLVIDELESITAGVKRTLVNEFQSLLTKIALTGREAGWHLLLSSQVASVGNGVTGATLSSSARAQMTLRIQLGRLDRSNIVQLFPELRDGGIPLPLGGKGSGIVSINDGEMDHFGVSPILMPTILNLEGD
ncbi:FtsK/SpoIIIE domain-containing protein [Limosilactobacillus agrestimuris]|uniref:FtsK/SpoIIIE domain-containing protein n=1 Tax=Limosilactobacillus agrestimuris TaxID=2941331 RepID=UPI00203E5DD9|nr:FtsK/SpoIIIE domain-containing protein [Limosilactobacillus agrestimuris]